jgi:hypothetical protein
MKAVFTYLILLMLGFTTMQDTYAQQRNSSTATIAEGDWVRIYPNPVVSDANISINAELDLERSRVTVVFYNIVGKEVLRISNIRQHDIRINREGFVSGMYIYQLKVDDKVQSTGRISFK